MNINPMDIFKNFKEIQNRMGEMQERMKDVCVIGTAGGDMVSIEMNGKMEVINVSISPEAVDPSDTKMLEDLVLAAFSNANDKIKEKIKEKMSEISGNMNIPPGMMGL